MTQAEYSTGGASVLTKQNAAMDCHDAKRLRLGRS